MSNIVNVLAPGEGLQKKVVDEVRAWRVRYRPIDDAPGTGEKIYRIREPKPMLASVETIEVAQAFEESGAAEGDQALTLLWLPSSLASGLFEEQVHSWLGDADDPEIVRAGIRTVRVAWKSDRCVIYAAAEQLADAMDAVVRFTLAKRQCDSLERRMAEAWADLDSDVPLSHGVQFWSARRRRINERTERITRVNAEFLRLQTALEQLDVKLASSSKRLYAELVLQATIYDRLEMMEEPIQFVMNHYELATTRRIELKTAFLEHWLEAAIVILLAAQVFVEITRH